MSFSIKCDKCGFVDKFNATDKSKRKKAIVLSTNHYGDCPDWYIITCKSCGHEIKENK